MTPFERECCKAVLDDNRRILRQVERKAEHELNPHLAHALELWGSELRAIIANLKMRMARHEEPV